MDEPAERTKELGDQTRKLADSMRESADHMGESNMESDRIRGSTNNMRKSVESGDYPSCFSSSSFLESSLGAPHIPEH